MAAISVWDGWIDAANQKKAVGLLIASCKRGGALSCTRLGVLSEEGALGTAARGDARNLFARACRLGWADACDRLK